MLHLVTDTWSPATVTPEPAPASAVQLREACAHLGAVGRHPRLDIHDVAPDLLRWAEVALAGIRHDHAATPAHPAFYAIEIRLHGVQVNLFPPIGGAA